MPDQRIFMVENFERPNWDEYFMLQAKLASLRSNCMTRSVGAVIVRDHRQLATGYNGTPPGIKNCFEGGCDRCTLRMEGKVKAGEGLGRCLCNHAEANAIMHCAISIVFHICSMFRMYKNGNYHRNKKICMPR